MQTRIEVADVLSVHKAAMLSHMADQQVILVAQDTTFLNFEQLQAHEEFGALKRTVRDEHLLHGNVAFTDRRVNFGSYLCTCGNARAKGSRRHGRRCQ